MVRYISIEAALASMEEIHKKVDPSDEFESLLYHDIIEINNILEEVKSVDLKKEVLGLLNLYFESYETVGFDYKM